MGKHISRRGFLSRSAVLVTAGSSLTSLPVTVGALQMDHPNLDSSDSSHGSSMFLNAKEYFAAPGFAFFLFHNQYFGGMQGGLQMIQNGKRVLDPGNFYIVPTGHARPPAQRALRRVVDRNSGTAIIFGEVEGWNTRYRLMTRTDGRQITIRLQVDRSLDRRRLHLYSPRRRQTAGRKG